MFRLLPSATGTGAPKQQPQQQQQPASGSQQTSSGAAGGEGADKAQPPPDNRTWWQKNWLFVMAGGTMVSWGSLDTLLLVQWLVCCQLGAVRQFSSQQHDQSCLKQ